MALDLMSKLTILAEGAKYDAACTSSGADRPGNRGLGSPLACGCCHSFAADGRCISLLKVLMTNSCVCDCQYCVNRSSNDVPRAAFTPDELAELTIQFYRRNYIEGLFLSSGILKDPDYTTERMVRALELLRNKHRFQGYIHAKAIPGTSAELIRRLGLAADRLSVNIELPSETSLQRLAPNKTKKAILTPMGQIRDRLLESRQAPAAMRQTAVFASAGQSTQLIIGATPESDYRILTLSASLYSHFDLKRVFYSAYVPVADNALLPALDTKPPLLREHRLYQADFLMRQYHFDTDEILSEETPNFNPYLDPKCDWAIRNMHFFPVDVNQACGEDLLRVPGIGPTSVRRILAARRAGRLGMAELKKIGVVLKRARYFIAAADFPAGLRTQKEAVVRALIDPGVYSLEREQLTLFGPAARTLAGQELLENGFDLSGGVLGASAPAHGPGGKAGLAGPAAYASADARSLYDEDRRRPEFVGSLSEPDGHHHGSDRGVSFGGRGRGSQLRGTAPGRAKPGVALPGAEDVSSVREGVEEAVLRLVQNL